jgi:hypothetical protein
MLDKLKNFLRKIDELLFRASEVRYLSVPIWRPWRD